MTVKFLILLLILLSLILIGSFIFKKSIRNYNPLTWFITELYWLSISFCAVCIGLIEIERLEKLNAYKEKEKQLLIDYQAKKNLLAAQTYLLKIDPKLPAKQLEGIKWFHKMKSLFEEGIYTHRWEGFLFFTRSYVLKEPGCYADLNSNALEFSWPQDTKLHGDDIFLKEEIRWVTDSLKMFQERKDKIANSKPEEITNYLMRYTLIILFLSGLSLKILRTYSDYKSKIRSNGEIKKANS